VLLEVRARVNDVAGSGELRRARVNDVVGFGVVGRVTAIRFWPGPGSAVSELAGTWLGGWCLFLGSRIG
jgi:hypothetical protein